MAIVLVRIDDRLVHGQVVEAWIPHLRASEVVVACDRAAADPTQRALMQMALPDRVALEVLGVSAAAEHLRRRAAEAGRVLVLAPSPREALSLLEAGTKFDVVNVGGLHYSAGRVQLGKVIFLSEEDKLSLKAIAERGVALEGRAVPSDRKMDIVGLLAAAA